MPGLDPGLRLYKNRVLASTLHPQSIPIFLFLNLEIEMIIVFIFFGLKKAKIAETDYFDYLVKN